MRKPWRPIPTQLADRMVGLENAAVTEEFQNRQKSKAQDHRGFAGSAGESPHLCGTELWAVLSYRNRGKAHESSDVPGNPQRLQPLLYRGDIEEPRQAELSV